MAIWSILWPFGIFYGHLVNGFAFWNVVYAPNTFLLPFDRLKAKGQNCNLKHFCVKIIGGFHTKHHYILMHENGNDIAFFKTRRFLQKLLKIGSIGNFDPTYIVLYNGSSCAWVIAILT
jgi:hypothetical protein